MYKTWVLTLPKVGVPKGETKKKKPIRGKTFERRPLSYVTSEGEGVCPIKRGEAMREKGSTKKGT